ncbi:MAG: hypothetical protein C4516_06495 [Oxalobacter sp.]|nr:MAG: hypothetical protein C4516_06495 [Oxalobacter sp.]
MNPSQRKAADTGLKESGPSLAPGYAEASGSQGSVTQSGISGAQITITDDAQQQERTGQDAATTIASLNRDVSTDKDSSNSLSKAWDGNKLQQQVQAEAQIVAEFGKNASKAVGDYAQTKEAELKAQADKAGTEAERKALMDEAKKWGEGGAYRVGLHTIVGGLTGNVQGALGAGASAYAVPDIAKQINAMDIPDGLKQTLIATAGTAAGAAVGGTSGASAAASQTVNNYLKHEEILALVKAIEEGDEEKKKELHARDAQRQNELNACGTTNSPECNSIRQEARNAAIEIGHNYQDRTVDIPSGYWLWGMRTIGEGGGTLDGGNAGYAKGAAIGAKNSVVNMAEGLWEAGKFAFYTQGLENPEIYEANAPRYQATGQALAQLLTSSDAREQAIRVALSDKVAEYTKALEAGDAAKVKQIYGEIAGQMGADILLPMAATKALNWAGKMGETVKVVETVADANQKLVTYERVMANVTEARKGNASSKIDLFFAKSDQIVSGYSADLWEPVSIKKGSVVYGLHPGESAYFTDFATVQWSRLDAYSLSQALQVKAHSIYGYRPDIKGFRVIQDLYVPGGQALANISVGTGGGNQFFIQNAHKYLEPITTINLRKP